ncbi:MULTISPECIES: histidine phosphatase family protein [Oceanobacillus]|uniref:Phosphoglycerate mutase n=1 Tax=Oceanobacillus neutriphilus TaxID=531815 RepID=A0ABQ2NVZ1_9BACI|nr:MULTISPECIES: histidine phosphatase family protein [Oceanobacillus]MCT1904594.1 histidine phosphatase family protein [Oceanobacillus sojae]GGP11910.1 phosphoglycerate mutase [Oceanobacillus neutriphilus]
MNKTIYIIRHCEAEGQAPDAPLTEKGKEQAEKLAAFLYEKKVDRIISSPFLRAIQTVEPLAEANNLKIKVDNRLRERVLSSASMPDWMTKLEATYKDLDLKYEGGESSNEATGRIVEAVNEIRESDADNSIIVAHGGIISLLLYYYDKNAGFEAWRKLSNPDIYALQISDDNYQLERLWEEEQNEKRAD